MSCSNYDYTVPVTCEGFHNAKVVFCAVVPLVRQYGTLVCCCGYCQMHLISYIITMGAEFSVL